MGGTLRVIATKGIILEARILEVKEAVLSQCHVKDGM
jgi:hypothetical protein